MNKGAPLNRNGWLNIQFTYYYHFTWLLDKASRFVRRQAIVWKNPVFLSNAS